MIPISYNIRSLAARRSTTLAAGLGIALVVFVFASVLMLSHGIETTLKASGSPENAIVLRKGSQAEVQSSLDENAVKLLRSAPEAATDQNGASHSAAEMVVLITAARTDGSGVSNVVLRGITPDTFALRQNIQIVEGRTFKPGSDEIIVGKRIGRRIKGAALGEELALKSNRTVRVVGYFAADGSSFESEMWGDLGTIGAIFNRQGIVSSVTLKLKDAVSFDALRARVTTDRRLALDVKREITYYEEQSQGLALFIRVLGLITAVFFSVGAMIGATITMYTQVAQRGREIGTLRALGFRRNSVLLSFMIESLLLSLLGGSVGAVAAMGMGFVEFSTLSFQSFSEVVFRFVPTPNILVSALFFASGMGLVGGFFPALRAARVSPLAAMRD